MANYITGNQHSSSDKEHLDRALHNDKSHHPVQYRAALCVLYWTQPCNGQFAHSYEICQAVITDGIAPVGHRLEMVKRQYIYGVEGHIIAAYSMKQTFFPNSWPKGDRFIIIAKLQCCCRDTAHKTVFSKHRFLFQKPECSEWTSGVVILPI